MFVRFEAALAVLEPRRGRIVPQRDVHMLSVTPVTETGHRLAVGYCHKLNYERSISISKNIEMLETEML